MRNSDEICEHARAVIYCEPLPNGEYVHALTCSGDRNVPPGTPGHSCSCRIAPRKLLYEAVKRAEAAEAERGRMKAALIDCACTLESLWASEHDGIALCDTMKAAIKDSLNVARPALGIDAALAPQAEKPT
jgi:hypothetical protein